MSRCHFRVGYHVYWTLLPIACGIVSTGAAQAACYTTPRAAIDSFKPFPPISPVADGSGYRVTSIQSDPILEQRWALIASCSHPEWPASALPLDGSSSASSSLQIKHAARNIGFAATHLVRAGDVVRLWKQEDLLRIEVAGVSEESGDLGDAVRVRLLHRNAEDQSTQAQFSGIIRGPADVEMQP
jgi:hypothetical protein